MVRRVGCPEHTDVKGSVGLDWATANTKETGKGASWEDWCLSTGLNATVLRRNVSTLQEQVLALKRVTGKPKSSPRKQEAER